MSKALALSLAFGWNFLSPIWTSMPPTISTVAVRLHDSRVLSFRCGGAGPQTVVLESGLGGDAGGWRKLQLILEDKYRVCSYDRAGSGLSDPAPNPRDANAIAADLSEGLQSLGPAKPVVLIAHSAGAIFSRRFAELYRDKVAAMVLVDPSVEYQDKRFAAKFGPGAGSVAPMRGNLVDCLQAARDNKLDLGTPAYIKCLPAGSAPTAAELKRRLEIASNPRAIANKISELDELWSTSSDEVSQDLRASENIPVIVLTAAGTYSTLSAPAKAQVDKLWLDLHLETASRYKLNQAITVENSSHLMMNDQPLAIAQAVDRVLLQARSR